jgi:hypothetical protein
VAAQVLPPVAASAGILLQVVAPAAD